MMPIDDFPKVGGVPIICRGRYQLDVEIRGVRAVLTFEIDDACIVHANGSELLITGEPRRIGDIEP